MQLQQRLVEVSKGNKSGTNWKPQINPKVQRKKVFSHVILHSSFCNNLCKFFFKIKNNECFCKTYSEIKARDQSIQARKKVFCHVIVRNYLCKLKNRNLKLTLLYYGRTVRSSHRRFSTRKLLLRFVQYPQETPLLESNFKNVVGL